MPQKPKQHSPAEPVLFAEFDSANTGMTEATDPATGGQLSQAPLALGAASARLIPLRQVTSRAGARRQLPYSKQFTPAQIPSLGAFLQAVQEHAGTPVTVWRGVFELLSPGEAEFGGPKRTMAYNALLSARDYGLVTLRKDDLTPFGQAMLALSNDDERVTLLARHILRNLHGIELVAGVHQLTAAGLHLDKEALADHFARGGLGSNRDGTDINGVGRWLARAGVFAASGWYEVDERTYERLAGVPLSTVKKAAHIDAVGLAILEQLALCPGYQSSTGELTALLEPRTDIRITRANFPKVHLEPLQAAGLIEMQKTTTGRGGFSNRVTGTAVFASEAVQHLLGTIRTEGFWVSGPELQVPFAELVPKMRDAKLSTRERGQALELFTLRLMLRMGLRNIRAAERPQGNEEIDGYAEALLPVHTRWQVQCKNSPTFNNDHAAREIGVAVRNRSTAIMMVTTGRFSKDASEFVDDVIRYSPYTVVRIDGKDVTNLARDETHIFEILAREAAKAKALRESSGAPMLDGSILADVPRSERSLT